MNVPAVALETPVKMECRGETLIGIVHEVRQGTVGLVFVVGGNQYRVGSHRLFVDLARRMAGAGYSSLRFDHRGIGDNAGEHAGFESLSEDIETAVASFRTACPTLEKLIAIGLCDGASAALLASRHKKIFDHMVLINPWVHSEVLEARTRIVSYYGTRLRSRTFWKKLLSGELRVRESVKSLIGYARLWLSRDEDTDLGETDFGASFTDAMRNSLAKFNGEMLIALSGQDLVSQQFQQLASIDTAWKSALEEDSVSIIKFPQADHTFSSRSEKEKLEEQLLAWCAGIDPT